MVKQKRQLKVLRVVGLVILGLFLFISLSVFGLALTINSTVLNPRFVQAELDSLDVSALVDEVAGQSSASEVPDKVRSSIIAAVDELEPDVKLQAKKAISRVYDYILGREQSLDLAGVLKETLLNKQFAVSVIEKAEVMELIRESLREELVEILPVGQQQLVPYIDEVMPRLDPWLKDQIDVVTSPVIDYLLGENTRLRVTISLDPMKSTLKAGLRDAFVRLPPPELAGASGDELDSIYNQYYEQFAAQIPSTTVIDEASLGMGSGDSFAQVITDAESALAEAKTAVGYFRTGYVLTLVFIGLLILGIILIWREVKGATRDLGIVLLIYGALEYGGVLVAKYFIRKALMLADLPSGLQSWLPGLVADVLRPVEILSLSLAVGGVALIVVSVVYRRRSSEVVTVRSDKEP